MKRVACLGASLTAGTVSANYVALLAARPELAGFTFINHGVNGDLAWNARQRLDGLIAEKPDVVTLLIGTNDVNVTLGESNRLYYIPYKHLPVEHPDIVWYEENLRAILTRLHEETSARLALISLAVIGEDLEHPINRQVARYNEVIRRLATELGAAYLPFYEQMLDYLQTHEADRATLPPRMEHREGQANINEAVRLDVQGLSWNEVSRRHGLLLTTDCLHLNETAAGMVADLIARYLLEPAAFPSSA